MSGNGLSETGELSRRIELFKEDDDEAMYKNPYEIRLCDLISVSLGAAEHKSCDAQIGIASPAIVHP